MVLCEKPIRPFVGWPHLRAGGCEAGQHAFWSPQHGDGHAAGRVCGRSTSASAWSALPAACSCPEVTFRKPSLGASGLLRPSQFAGAMPINCLKQNAKHQERCPHTALRFAIHGIGQLGEAGGGSGIVSWSMWHSVLDFDRAGKAGGGVCAHHPGGYAVHLHEDGDLATASGRGFTMGLR